MSDNAKALYETVMDILDVCSKRLPSQHDQLLALEMAWLVRAQAVRWEALAIPGEFQTVRDHQADDLLRLAELVRSDIPDVELERAKLEGDHDGVVRHFERLLLERRQEPGRLDEP
jgi:hypothetical protein